MLNRLVLALLTLVVFSCSQQKENNWPQYLGPDRNATISDAGILRQWPESGPAKVWEFPLGPGYGGAAVFDGEVFVLDRIKGESDVLRCIDLETGAEKWNYSYEAKGELPYPGSRAVPVVDENYVWCVGPHGHFHCIDKKTQQAVWMQNLLSDYGGELNTWGFSVSPIVSGNLVIVSPQGETAGVVAYNKTSGEVVWESRRLSGYRFHVSPVLGNYGGVEQVIMTSSCVKGDGFTTDEVVAFEVKTGKELWSYKGFDSFACIAPPVAVDDKHLLLTSCAYKDRYDPVTILLEVNNDGEIYRFNELFRNEEAGCKMHPPLVIGQHIYLNNNRRVNEMVCLNWQGERCWPEKSTPGFELGSIVMVDGMLINQNGKNGDLHLIEPTPEGYKEVGKASFFTAEKSQAWSPMAFANGKLLARDNEKLVCVELKES
ncbi:PQQ-binding-like beta-propeller repeat protein [uncultured Draconibacterium sp.]|uniref:PQQ-binding-like beta-propeller repeat protein n=1 Tax=uncultured Draconibacterium sp. TaxID=1573823 RepID=UPI0025E7596B|nr:PQQ-binding-like beta-propeller repeat protein [uncultured Draconibacterium sp.]